MPQEGEVKTWLETQYGDRIDLQGICSIGRAESNNVIVSKGEVSRHHAVIHEREKAHWIVDLGGVNGILLNGNRVVQSARLNSGDVIGIPTIDFIFYHKAASAEAPASPVLEAKLPQPTTPATAPLPALSQTNPSPEPALTKESAPTAPKANSPLESSPAVASKPESSPPSAELVSASAVTIPLPHLRKPTQQEELPLGLPPQPIGDTGKLKKPRVYIGPVDTQGLPKAPPAKPAPPEALKSPENVALEPSRTSPLPKPSDDLLKVTTPLSSPLAGEKPREMTIINAPDVIVPTAGKPKTPPALPKRTVEADSFLQPSSSQEAASSTKSLTPLQKSKESPPLPANEAAPAPKVSKAPPPLTKAHPQPAAPIASDDSDSLLLPSSGTKEPSSALVIPRSSTPAKPAETKQPTPANPAPALPVAAKSNESKKPDLKPFSADKKVPLSAVAKAAPQTGSPASEIPTPQGILCSSARQSMYVGFASIFLPFFGLITATIAIILGHSALKKIDQSRGALIGRQSAVMGLYFGYIALGAIASYSILLYVLFAPHGAWKQSAGTSAPIVLSPPTFTTTTPSPSATETASKPAQASSSSTTAASTDTSSGRPTPAPETSPSPSPVSQPEAPSHPSLSSTPQTIVNDSTGGNVPTPPQGNPSPAVDTTTAPSAANATPAHVPAVYNAAVQERLKDGMLEQPMPEDTSSPAYEDAEAFNDCARLLARPPEAKYAESVGDFLEGVKKRKPDPARLQILSVMYENYMAGIKRDF